MPGAPCAFVQEAAAESTCAGCQQAELGTQLPPGLFTGVCGTASGTQGLLQCRACKELRFSSPAVKHGNS